MNPSSPRLPNIAQQPMPRGGVGYHQLFDFYQCDTHSCNDLEGIEHAMVDAAKRAGAVVIDVQSKRFEPYGISSIVVLAESHLSLHSWPEHNFAAVDLFTCTPNICAETVKQRMQQQLQAQLIDTQSFRRGWPISSS